MDKDSVLAAIDRCMQRDGEPLSLVALIEAGTFSVSQAAWLVAMVDQGASWLVGAAPGGAGKTTLMSALLTFVPSRETAVVAGPGSPWTTFGPDCCAVTEEISPHMPAHYLWAQDVRGLTAVPGQGGRITSTIHADTLEEAREQIARQCAAGEAGLAAFSVFIPIRVAFAPESAEQARAPRGRGHYRTVTSRTVQRIHYYGDTGWQTVDREVRLTAAQELILRFLEQCLQSGTRSCEQVRRAWLARGA